MSVTATADARLFPLDRNSVIIKPAEAVHGTWSVRLPASYAYADIFEPGIWRTIELQMQAMARRPQRHDLLRIIAADNSFDVVCSIEDISRGYVLRYHHGRLPDEAA